MKGTFVSHSLELRIYLQKIYWQI